MKLPRALAPLAVLLPAFVLAAAPCGAGEPPAPAGPAPPGATGTVLGIAGGHFTLNGEPAFLLGFSYYGGLGASEESVRRDLEEAKRLGFNWLRVWATWESSGEDVSAVELDGRPREPFLGKLVRLVEECDRRGLAVDVTLTRTRKRISSIEPHRRAVETLVGALKAHRNWFLDLANERDVGDDRFVSVAELEVLRELARKLDPPRLVTASFGGHDLSPKDIREALLEAGADFLCPHRPREAGSPAETESRTRAARAAMAEIGRVAPVLYQEPFRRGYGSWQPKSSDFLTDLRGAVAGGAAGWCFHNGQERGAPGNRPGRSFDLRRQRLFEQFDGEEQAFVREAAKAKELGGLPGLKVGGGGRLLATERDEPFFWLGDTAWSLRLLRPEDLERYLSHRALHRFDVIQVHCGHHVADHAGNRPFLGDDPARPNEAFWRTIDGIVAGALDHRPYARAAASQAPARRRPMTSKGTRNTQRNHWNSRTSWTMNTPTMEFQTLPPGSARGAAGAGSRWRDPSAPCGG